MPGDPEEMPLVRDQDILLEPPRWADLRIVSDSPAGRYVWLLEIKAGAPLELRQNPEKAEFSDPEKGYGALFNSSEANKNSRLRYIVLGAQEVLRIPPKHPTLPIALRQSHWDEVAACKASKLIRDFFGCLSNLQLQPFAMDEAKEISVTHGLSGAGGAMQVLKAVRDWLGAKQRPKDEEIYSLEPESVVGAYIKRGAMPPSGKLQDLSDSKDVLAWVGYFATESDQISRGVWLYFSDAKKRDRALSEVKLRFPIAEPEPDGDYCCVKVKAEAGGKTKDFAWFQSVFEAAGVAIPK